MESFRRNDWTECRSDRFTDLIEVFCDDDAHEIIDRVHRIWPPNDRSER